MSELLDRLGLPMSPTTWIVIIVGTFSGALALVFGSQLFRRRSTRLSLIDELAKEEPPPLDSPSERRRSLRRKGSAVKVELTHTDGPQYKMSGRVLDRSVGGLRVEVHEEVAIGTILKIRPHTAPRETPSVELEVRSCTKEGLEWQLGCAYVRVPVWSVQMLFE